MKKRGFTLIELIVVIVVLAIISVIAIPKYINLRGEAQKAVAQGVLGAANSAVALNFANRLLTPPGGSAPVLISDANALKNQMVISTSQGDWIATGNDLVWTTPGSNSKVFTITVTPETDTAPAVLTFTPAP